MFCFQTSHHIWGGPMPCVLLALDVGSMHGDDDNGIEKLQAKKKIPKKCGWGRCRWEKILHA